MVTGKWYVFCKKKTSLILKEFHDNLARGREERKGFPS